MLLFLKDIFDRLKEFLVTPFLPFLLVFYRCHSIFLQLRAEITCGSYLYLSIHNVLFFTFITLCSVHYTGQVPHWIHRWKWGTLGLMQEPAAYMGLTGHQPKREHQGFRARPHSEPPTRGWANGLTLTSASFSQLGTLQGMSSTLYRFSDVGETLIKLSPMSWCTRTVVAL